MTLKTEDDYLTITVCKNPVAIQAVWSAESGSDLTDWAVSSVVVLQDDNFILRARDTVPLSTGVRRFLHGVVTLP